MKTKISALLDGELGADEVRQVCIAMREDAELRDAYKNYLLIGDALRHEPYLATDIAASVLRNLASEPVVLAPRGRAGALPARNTWQRPLMAMAATLAGVAVVAWLGVNNNQPPQQVAAQSQPQQQVVMASADIGADMQEYLIAHQVHGGSMYLNGEAQHIRTVSMNGAGMEAH